MFGPKTAPTVSKGNDFRGFAMDSFKFTQDLSDWCVSGVEKGEFTADAFKGASRDDSLNPKWGECPGYSFR